MSAIFKLDARSYSFSDGEDLVDRFSETGIHGYSINKIPTTSPFNANAQGPVFQSDAPKRFEFEIVGGSGNPYSGLILPGTVNSDLTDLGGSAFSIVTAFRMRDFHVSAGGTGTLMVCQRAGAGVSGSWLLAAQEVASSTFRMRFATEHSSGSPQLIQVMDEILDPDVWWVVSGNFNGSTWFWHLDTEPIADIGSGITSPGSGTSVEAAVGTGWAAAASMDGDLGYLGIFKPNLSSSALGIIECDLMDYFKGQPCEAETGYRFDCSTIDSQIN